MAEYIRASKETHTGIKVEAASRRITMENLAEEMWQLYQKSKRGELLCQECGKANAIPTDIVQNPSNLALVNDPSVIHNADIHEAALVDIEARIAELAESARKFRESIQVAFTSSEHSGPVRQAGKSKRPDHKARRKRA